MDNKKLFVGCTFLIIILAGWFVFRRLKNKPVHGVYTIGILQTVTHPALNAVKQGFIDELKKKLGDKVAFVVKNAEGSTISIHTLAERFHIEKEIKAIFAIATPAVQAVVLAEKNKPVFVAAISDIQSVGIDKNSVNVCGITDMNNINTYIKSMHMLLPTIKSAALIYNNAEINSLTQVNLIEKELLKLNIIVYKKGVTSETDVSTAVAQAARTADVLIAPTDNMVANTIATITSLAREYNKPFITSDNLLVVYGALMARGVSFYQCGQETARQAIDVICNHKKPSQFGVVSLEKNELTINKERFEHFNLSLPAKMTDVPVFVSSLNQEI